MIYLLTAIAAMTLIMLALKFFNVKGIYIPQVVMVNYALAFAIAVINGRDVISAANIDAVFRSSWWYLAPIAGLLYFGSMDIMAASTRKAGVAITTMASRTSVILPILWACLFLGERITVWEIVGTLLVLLAFALIIYRPQRNATVTTESRREKAAAVIMPLLVFLSVGFIAVCMKTSQHLIKTSGEYATDYPLFEMLLFGAAVIGAATYYGIREGRQAFRPQWRSIIGGLCLGTFNYILTLGLMNGLKYFSSSTFYGVYNISVVILTTLAGVAIFREKLDGVKIAGLAVAVTSIVILGFLGNSL